MEPLICGCMEYVDPNNVCLCCGYPLCETDGCISVPGCDHNFADRTAVPKRLRKKLRYAYSKHQIEYHVATIQCFACCQNYCEECYDAFAIRYCGYLFRPSIAFKYSAAVRQAAMGLYLVNKQRPYEKKLPKELLLKVISFL